MSVVGPKILVQKVVKTSAWFVIQLVQIPMWWKQQQLILEVTRMTRTDSQGAHKRLDCCMRSRRTIFTECTTKVSGDYKYVHFKYLQYSLPLAHLSWALVTPRSAVWTCVAIYKEKTTELALSPCVHSPVLAPWFLAMRYPTHLPWLLFKCRAMDTHSCNVEKQDTLFRRKAVEMKEPVPQCVYSFAPLKISGPDGMGTAIVPE